MRSTLIGILMLMFVSHPSFAAVAQYKITVKGKVPEGVMISKNKVIAKKGYVIEKVSKSKAVARMRGGRGGITGDFDCTCNGADGGCSVVTTPNSVTCVQGTCKSMCMMIVTIPGTPVPAIAR